MDPYRVVPMRFFASWEIDRQSSNCVPRVCTMVLTRLTVLRPLESTSDSSCLVITVKLQGYKRILRCNDLVVSAVNGIIDIDLDISFTLQYPHFLKRKSNCIHVLLQRRKRYKSRPIPGGYKTIAMGVINLTEVLQSSIDRELCLFDDDAKLDESIDRGLSTTSNSLNASGLQQQAPVAKLYFRSCGTQPLEHVEPQSNGHRAHVKLNKEQLLDPEFSDEEADEDSTNEELGGGSDSDGMCVDEQQPQTNKARTEAIRKMKGGFNKLLLPSSAVKHRNVKQRFAAILKKFKVSAEVLNPESIAESQATSRELEALFEELDNLSESGGELDNVSQGTIHSEPKPRLPIFFHTSSTKGSKETLSQKERAQCLSDESRDSLTEDNSAENSPRRIKKFDLKATQQTSSTSKPFSPSPGSRHSDTHLVREKLHTINSLPSTVTAEANTRAALSQQYGTTSTTSSQQQLNLRQPNPSMAQSAAALKRDFLNQHPPNTTTTSSTSTHVTPSEAFQRSLDDRPALNTSTSVIESSTISTPRAIKHAINAGKNSMEPLAPLKHRVVSEQLAEQIASSDTLPEQLWLVSAQDVHSQDLISYWSRDQQVIVGSGSSDVRSVLISVLSKIQKFCNSNASAPKTTTICLIGTDRFFSYAIRAYTELFAHKSNEWQFYVRFCIITSGLSLFSRVLSMVDTSFALGSVFTDSLWRDWWDRTDLIDTEITEITARIRKYVQLSKSLLPLPIAEAMLQLRDKGVSDENSQVFVPFICDVRFGAVEGAQGCGGQVPECDSPSQVVAPALPLVTATASSVAAGGSHQLPSSSSGVTGSGSRRDGSQSQQVAALTLASSSYDHGGSGGDKHGHDMTAGILHEGLVHSSNTPNFSPPASPHTLAHSSPNASDPSPASTAQELTLEYWTSISQWTSGGGGGTMSGTSTSARDASTSVSSTGAVGMSSRLDAKEIPIKSDRSDSNAALVGMTPLNKRQDSFSATSPIKYSLKTLFKSLNVSRLPVVSSTSSSASSAAAWMVAVADAPSCLVVNFVKEKKKEKMFLRMKTRDKTRDDHEQRQQVNAVSRLICSSKHSTIKIQIDGVEYSSVKFFQVSPQWQTHVKQFPLAVCLESE